MKTQAPKVDPYHFVDRPFDRVFPLTDKQLQGLTEEQVKWVKSKLAALYTARCGFRFHSGLESNEELVTHWHVDLYPQDEVTHEVFMSHLEDIDMGDGTTKQLDGNIALLAKGMVNAHGVPVTLYYEERQTKEMKDLLPRFYVVGHPAPKHAPYWPNNPKGLTRLSLSISQLKQAIDTLPRGESRYHRCYSMQRHRPVRNYLQGQKYAAVKVQGSSELEGETKKVRPTQFVVATDPFAGIEKVEKKDGVQTIITFGKNVPIRDDGNGPYAVVHEQQRPIIVLVKADLLANTLAAYSLMEPRDRKDFLRRQGDSLNQRDIRTARKRRDFSGAERAQLGTPESEEEVNKDEESVELGTSEETPAETQESAEEETLAPTEDDAPGETGNNAAETDTETPEDKPSESESEEVAAQASSASA